MNNFLKKNKFYFIINFAGIVFVIYSGFSLEKTNLFLIFSLVIIFLFNIIFIYNLIKSIHTSSEQINSYIEQTNNSYLKIKGSKNLENLIISINKLISNIQNVKSSHKKSELSRQQLITNISHDIRTPLTSIIGYIEALYDNIAETPEEEKSFLEIIRNKSYDLKNHIEDIFHLAKIDSDEIQFKMEKIDLAEISRETIIEFLPIFKKNEIKTEIDIPNRPLLIKADHNSILRIIRNIIQNSLKHGSKGKYIGVTIEESDKKHTLSITDRGKGIEADKIDKIFDRLYQTQKTSEIHTGTGLGLTISKLLTERNNGDIRVSSIPNTKTIFYIQFPKYYN